MSEKSSTSSDSGSNSDNGGVFGSLFRSLNPLQTKEKEPVSESYAKSGIASKAVQKILLGLPLGLTNVLSLGGVTDELKTKLYADPKVHRMVHALNGIDLLVAGAVTPPPANIVIGGLIALAGALGLENNPLKGIKKRFTGATGVASVMTGVNFMIIPEVIQIMRNIPTITAGLRAARKIMKEEKIQYGKKVGGAIAAFGWGTVNATKRTVRFGGKVLGNVVQPWKPAKKIWNGFKWFFAPLDASTNTPEPAPA